MQSNDFFFTFRGLTGIYHDIKLRQQTFLTFWNLHLEKAVEILVN